METEHETETEKAVTEPVVQHTPPPVTPPATAHDDTRSIVDGLVSKVEELSQTVQSLIPKEHDSVPGKKPWTHWGK